MKIKHFLKGLISPPLCKRAVSKVLPSLCKGGRGRVDHVLPPLPLLTKEGCLLLAILILLFTSCGGGGSATSSSQSSCTGACGVVKLFVTGSKSFNPKIDHGRIVSYRVTITGDGIDTPIVATFDGSATEGVIDSIPTGPNKQITVEAINPNDLTIRQGEKSDVTIEGGKTADVEVHMESVPIFTNIADGGIIDNTRLIFQIFSDPASPVKVEDITSDATSAIADISTMATEVSLDTSTGLGRMAPALQLTGEHKYKVFDVSTGRSSVVTVKILDGTKRKGAPFVAAGNSESTARRRVSCGTH